MGILEESEASRLSNEICNRSRGEIQQSKVSAASSSGISLASGCCTVAQLIQADQVPFY
uniref:Uncharacterized protein n=1 Tax=Lepeophtheirus salmonis TaxID=72036 RepID=A0A0K2T3K9_LEPSM